MSDLRRVDWPDDLDRTPHEARESWTGTNGSVRSRAKRVLTSVDNIDGRNVDLETNMRHGEDKPNLPRLDSGNPPDPAVVVRFELDGEQCIVAADGSPSVRDNLRAVENYIESQWSAHGRDVPPEMFDTVKANIDSVY